MATELQLVTTMKPEFLDESPLHIIETEDISDLMETFYCDFEDDSCGTEPEGQGRYKWIRGQGETFTPGTGPRKDHTFASELGKFDFL